MSAKPLIALAALALLGARPPHHELIPNPDKVAAFLKACDQKDGWRDPAPPLQIDRNVYLVGTCGINVLLISSPQGHVLIDSAEEEAVPQIIANVRALGFNPRDIKWLLTSHSHFDHAGGLAAMQASTNAKIAALPAQARELRQGAPMEDDPQFGAIKGIHAVQVDRELQDGVPLLIGPNRITPFATPGHTAGSTSYVIRGCGLRNCQALTYADSTSAISAGAYRFADHPAWVAQFRKGVARIATLPCTVLITPHPSSSELFERLAGDAPLADKAQCKRYSELALARLDERLAKEAAAK